MATATMPAKQVTTTANGNALDETIAATEKRRSLVGSAATVLGVKPDQLCGLLRNVWSTSKGTPALTDQEMFNGISMIARYELDPIAREVYVTKAKDGRLMTVIGVDGWIKILDRTDHYDGFEQEIHETDKGEVDWIETRIYSKNRSKPTVYRAFMREYKQIAGFIAGKLPIHMLGIFSLRHAARRFVPLGGHIVTDEEAAYMGSGGAAEAAGNATKLDELADRLMQPVEQHASEGDQDDSRPGSATAPRTFADFITAIESCTQLGQPTTTHDMWDRSSWSDEQREEAKAIVNHREESLKTPRGTRSNKQQELVK